MQWLRWAVLLLLNVAFIAGGKLLQRRQKLLLADRIAGIAVLSSIDTFTLLRHYFSMSPGAKILPLWPAC
jgi:hypothetical protein